MKEIARKYLQLYNINDIIRCAKYCINQHFKMLCGISNAFISDIYPIEIPNKSDVVGFENIKNLFLGDSGDFNTDSFPACIGKLYEYSLSREQRKDYGQFYTWNIAVIDVMLKNINLLSGKILEPSCGVGSFILKIIKQISNTLKSSGFESEYILSYIQDNIYGNDIDGCALEITEINMIASLLPLMADAYRRNPSFHMQLFHLSQKDFTRKGIFGCNFSLIIGNPPFVTMYGKRSRTMTEEKRIFYNTFKFVQNKNKDNKFNLSMFFVENALETLVTDGRLIYVVDSSFFETAYADLRNYLINNFHINRIIKGIRTFDNVASGQAVIDVSKSMPSDKKTLTVDYSINREEYISQELWNNEDGGYKIYIPLEAYEQNICDKVQKFPKLEELFPNKSLRTCCALTGKTDEFVVNEDSETECTVFPYIEGSKGLAEKFGHLHPTKYIKYDYNLQLEISERFRQELEKNGIKNKKRVTLGDKESYISPKIFIRQSSFQIIATYTDKPFAANNSIYVLTDKGSSPQEKSLLKYVCGLLNSDLITYYCIVCGIIRMEKGKVPQLKISDLKKIRICIDNERYDDIVSLTDTLLENPCNSIALKQLNMLVYEIYHINDKEVSIICDKIH